MSDVGYHYDSVIYHQEKVINVYNYLAASMEEVDILEFLSKTCTQLLLTTCPLILCHTKVRSKCNHNYNMVSFCYLLHCVTFDETRMYSSTCFIYVTLYSSLDNNMDIQINNMAGYYSIMSSYLLLKVIWSI